MATKHIKADLVECVKGWNTEFSLTGFTCYGDVRKTPEQAEALLERFCKRIGFTYELNQHPTYTEGQD